MNYFYINPVSPIDYFNFPVNSFFGMIPSQSYMNYYQKTQTNDQNLFFLPLQTKPFNLVQQFPQQKFNYSQDSFERGRQIKEQILKGLKKKEKISKISKLNKTPVHQNPHRNIYTNLGNQILTFLFQKKKSYSILMLCFPNLSIDQQQKFYEFAYQVKRSVNGYINHSKLQKIWKRKDLKTDQIPYQKILRTLSYYYLSNMVVPAVLTSKKMAKQTLYEHLIIRRALLETLNEQFNQ